MLALSRSQQTPVSNTGLDSQKPFTAGIDWLDVTFRGVGSGADLMELISDLESILKASIDFSTTRSTFNGKHWAGSGRSDNGALIWYNPPRAAAELLEKGPDGNLFTHPGLLPLGCYPMTREDVERVRASLPVYAHLIRLEKPPVYVEPVTGNAYPHHGYSIEASGIACEPSVGELKIACSARVLDRADLSQVAEYLRVISGVYVVECSRIDVCLDDYAKLIPISAVLKASGAGNFFNARYTKRIESGNRGEETGVTVYFGSPTSDAKLRVYDKTVESKGRCDCNRWEVEFHRKKANAFMSMWLEWMVAGTESASAKMADIVVSFIDFRDRSSGDPNRGRCPELDWYTELKAAVKSKGVRISAPCQAPSMQKTVDWLRTSVSSSFASVRKVLGDDFWPYLTELMDYGSQKMSPLRRKMAAACDKEYLCWDVEKMGLCT